MACVPVTAPTLRLRLFLLVFLNSKPREIFTEANKVNEEASEIFVAFVCLCWIF